VARKVLPVPGTLPEEYRIVRRVPEDPLLTLPDINPYPPSSHPSSFKPGKRLTQERWEEFYNRLVKEGFLWEKEIDLAASILKNNEKAVAWVDSERGTFSRAYFDPVRIPTIEHVPWVRKDIRIPPGIKETVLAEIQRKIDTGVYEPSNSSYRSSWFIVPKKDGSPRIVHNLEPLNAVTIRDAGVPPVVEEVVEDFAGRVSYFYGDLYVGYDERELDERSRDLTTFQTPKGTLRSTALPMGYTNAVSIFHGDVTFILMPEIPRHCRVFIDDVGGKGPKSYYRLADGSYECITENSGIRRFVWEHFEIVNRILHRISHAGATFSAKKLHLCLPEISILGHACNYEGRIPDKSHIAKIMHWPLCANITEVRGFLGVLGLVRIFIKNFAARANALNKLTRKEVEFEWGAEQQAAMDDLKNAATTAGALVPIDYESEREVVLAVDSSVIAVGYILGQRDQKLKVRPARYGSVTWNEVESRYSQAKLELYGLARSLKEARVFIWGVKNLTIEVDAKYIKGMLNNPDVLPSATLNRWIAYIQLFQFKLKHVPKELHKGPDGLSRRAHAEEDGEDPTQAEFEEEVERRFETLAILASEARPRRHVECLAAVVSTREVGEIPENPKFGKKEEELAIIRKFLETFHLPEGIDQRERRRLLERARHFFQHKGNLYKRREDGRHQKFVPREDRYAILEQAHSEFGHKGFYSVRQMLADRFWWPSLSEDLKWYLQTCHECQIYNPFKVHLPPTVPEPAPLFQKVHVDTMFMEPSGGFRYIAHARCSLSAWSEWRPLRKETGATLGKFLLDMVLCRWGAVPIIVTDNGKPWIKALEWLGEIYRIHHIRISGYNSQAQGIIERQHRTVRDSIVRMCGENPKEWVKHAPYAFWADRVTVRRSTGHSPFYLAHGCEPLLPFDIAEATYLVPGRDKIVSTAELVALRGRQLEKRSEDLDEMRNAIWKARKLSAEEFTRTFASSIREYNFPRGSLVLVRDSAREMDLGRKWKPRYAGPYVVLAQNEGGSYTVMELDGAASKSKIAAKRLIPYALRSVVDLTKISAKLVELPDSAANEEKELDEDTEL
jgi:hypothetical protein